MVGQDVIHAAGIIDQDEADLLFECGFTHLGFPFRLAKNKPDLTEQEAARIIQGMQSDATALLITYLHNPEEVIELCEQLGVTYVQLHGAVSIDELSRLKDLRPDFTVIKSLVVREGNQADLLEDVAKTAPFLDGYITDTFDPRTGATGATGMVHDWSVSRRLTADSPRPLIMAGGLNADNVADAIRAIRPAGVDVHTGIEGPNGRKDPVLSRRFVTEARQAFKGVSRKDR
jgi:phosphoribosylanthranilate isomerase